MKPGLAVWITTDGDGLYEFWSAKYPKPTKGRTKWSQWRQCSRKGNLLGCFAELVNEEEVLRLLGGDRSMLPTEEKPVRMRLLLERY